MEIISTMLSPVIIHVTYSVLKPPYASKPPKQHIVVLAKLCIVVMLVLKTIYFTR
jgi:hypothetical protein